MKIVSSSLKATPTICLPTMTIIAPPRLRILKLNEKANIQLENLPDNISIKKIMESAPSTARLKSRKLLYRSLKTRFAYTKYEKLAGKNTNPKAETWSPTPQNNCYQSSLQYCESNGQLIIELYPDTPKLQLIFILGVYLNLQRAQTARKFHKTLAV